MNKFIILSCLLILGFASCLLPNIEKVCKDFTLEDLTLHATCRTDSTWDAMSLDLNTCLTAKNGILLFPGTNLRDFCDNCYLKGQFTFYCKCSKMPLSDSNTDTEATTRPNLLISYMRLRDFITLENRALHC